MRVIYCHAAAVVSWNDEIINYPLQQREEIILQAKDGISKQLTESVRFSPVLNELVIRKLQTVTRFTARQYVDN
jgi:hypothetical protein